MSVRDRRRHKIKELPGTLSEALEALKKDQYIQDALGAHIAEHFLEAKTVEFDDYRVTVHEWELDTYLSEY